MFDSVADLVEEEEEEDQFKGRRVDKKSRHRTEYRIEHRPLRERVSRLATRPIYLANLCLVIGNFIIFLEASQSLSHPTTKTNRPG